MQRRIQGVCLAGPFVPQVSYSALKLIIKDQTLSLQVSNAGGLEQAKAYLSLLTQHVLIRNNNVPALHRHHQGGPRGSLPPKFLEHIVILCFERQYPPKIVLFT